MGGKSWCPLSDKTLTDVLQLRGLDMRGAPYVRHLLRRVSRPSYLDCFDYLAICIDAIWYWPAYKNGVLLILSLGTTM
jgi:hypothetical protein